MTRDALSKGTIYFLLSLGAILMILPFIWMISTSVKAPNEVMAMPPIWIPGEIKWDNFLKALEVAPFDRYFVNSVIVTLLSTVGELLTTILAAYAFSRINFFGRDICFAILLGTMMVPGEVLIIPNFVTLSNLGWINTYQALIIPWIASVFAIFLLRQFFLTIPNELSYAAKIDGCRDFTFLWYVMVPLAKPAIITIALLKIINSWNAFLWPLIVTNSKELRTLPVGLSAFTTEAGIKYELLMAASSMVILPMIILFFIMQKYIVAGVARAGLKG
ncbi:carbohydrate ABC transporter permease [Siminovitchia sp. FSL H7-0308]|uniref:Multiple sugar transport system permease protein n=1 Tax=Siminovitchia thermophila TaxID=1245522 RepID=A0ABS2RC33_9BACI|nr:carbohydrate ABC transporter permease [Siminovitchia thermophila]MBM7717221.1 multiple sugar transport system permease protein [Siminovitchia thermophila]ONK23009.1 ABC transporter permease [Bacillus sp. VT-16-64]